MDSYAGYMVMSSLSHSILGKTITGNALVDNILCIMMFMVCVFCVSQINRLPEHIRMLKKKIGWSKESYVEYEGTIITNGEKMKCNLPIEMTAINAHISRNCNNIKKIKILKEDPEGDDLNFLIEDCNNMEIESGYKLSTYQLMRLSQDSKQIINHYYMKVSSDAHSISQIMDKVEEWRELVEDILRDKYVKNDRVFVYSHNQSDHPNYKLRYEQYPIDENRTFDNLCFEGKDRFMSQLDFFLNHEEEYAKLGKPYTLGVLLYGDPGCGKTSIIKALCNYTKRYMQTIPLGKVKTNTELRKLFCGKYINDFKIDTSKKIIVLEDIDCLSDIIQDRGIEYVNADELDARERAKHSINSGKHNDANNYEDSKKMVVVSDQEMMALEEEKKKKRDRMEMMMMMKAMGMGKGREDPVEQDTINLACLLELLDGTIDQRGRIVVITTNYVDRLDRAFIRTGRMDIKLRLTKCSTDTANNIVKLHYGNDCPEISIPDKTVTPSDLVGLFFGNKFETFLQISGFDLKSNETNQKSLVQKSLILKSDAQRSDGQRSNDLKSDGQRSNDLKSDDRKSNDRKSNDLKSNDRKSNDLKSNEPDIQVMQDIMEDIDREDRDREHKKFNKSNKHRGGKCDKCHKKKLI